MRLFLIDPGLRSRLGHHFNTNLAVCAECEARGIPTIVFANYCLESEIRAKMLTHAMFRATAPKPDHVKNRCFRSDFETLNRLTEDDLHANCKCSFDPEDLLLVPTARVIHLTGIQRWYSTLPEPRPKVCLRLLFTPWFRTKADERELAVEVCANQIRAWSALAGEKLSLVAERVELARYYEALTGIPVSVLPMPIRYPSASRDPLHHRNNGDVHISFLGGARREKGFHLLAKAMRPIFEKRPQVRLTVQTAGLFDAGEDVVEELKGLSSRVSTVSGPLPISEYETLLLSTDVVLVAYDPEAYALRASQVFAEAVGLGKAVVVTRGTWMEKELKRLGIHYPSAEAFTSVSLSTAIERLLDDWENVRHKSEAGASAWRDRHNHAAFVDELLRVVGC